MSKRAPPLYPSWPASSTWVTAVGATRFKDQTPAPAGRKSEVASDDFGSCGGFSRIFEQFEDQKKAVKEYFKRAPALPTKGTFPRTGRGTPDLACLGEGFQVLVSGELQSLDGTSASTPVFAAVVSLLNEARLAKGLPAMGYLNPWLYQNTHMFNDIEVGTNDVLGGGQGKMLYGYNCTKGWDPVTGLGTPKFDSMLDAALKAGAATSLIV